MDRYLSNVNNKEYELNSDIENLKKSTQDFKRHQEYLLQRKRQ